MQGVIPFSHVFFGGDLVFFVKVDWENCIVVRDVLDSFCALSSKKKSIALISGSSSLQMF